MIWFAILAFACGFCSGSLAQADRAKWGLAFAALGLASIVGAGLLA